MRRHANFQVSPGRGDMFVCFTRCLGDERGTSSFAPRYNVKALSAAELRETLIDCVVVVCKSSLEAFSSSIIDTTTVVAVGDC